MSVKAHAAPATLPLFAVLSSTRTPTPSMCAVIPESAPYLGRSVKLISRPTFEPLTDEAYDAMFHRRRTLAAQISVVAYQAPWDRQEHVPGPILEAVARQWQDARFFSMALTRGTPNGERIFAALEARGFTAMPIIDVFCGSERIDTLVLPRGEGGGEGAACPLFTERRKMSMLQQAVAAAQRRVSSNRRWRERRRVLLALRQVRHDLRRLARFKGAGLLSRSWTSTKETNTLYRDPSKAPYSDEQMRRARRKHLHGLRSHAQHVSKLTTQRARLERRLHLLRRLVLGAQRCSEHGCELVHDDGTLGECDDGPALIDRCVRAVRVVQPPLLQHAQQGATVISAAAQLEAFAAHLTREQQRCEEEGCLL